MSPELLITRHVEDARRQLSDAREHLKSARRRVVQLVRYDTDHDGQPGTPGGNGSVISGDGAWMAFSSDAANLVPGDTNGVSDVFERDFDPNS